MRLLIGLVALCLVATLGCESEEVGKEKLWRQFAASHCSDLASNHRDWSKLQETQEKLLASVAKEEIPEAMRRDACVTLRSELSNRNTYFMRVERDAQLLESTAPSPELASAIHTELGRDPTLSLLQRVKCDHRGGSIEDIERYREGFVREGRQGLERLEQAARACGVVERLMPR